MFGGNGTGSPDAVHDFTWSWLNDLWKFTVSTQKWQLMVGSGNPNQQSSYVAEQLRPGSVYNPSEWTDPESGNLYLFGGYGYDTSSARGYAANMWSFDVKNNKWALSNPSGVVGSALYAGSYFTAPNYPSGRIGAYNWVDKQGNLWMYGGFTTVFGSQCYLICGGTLPQLRRGH